MLSVSNAFKLAEQADVNQIAANLYLVLGNYASASAYGSTASASSSDGSGNYPASGSIDGDRTEINVGAASAADNDVGLSSWRSSVAPDTTPQTLTIDFGVSRKLTRLKLYHLASHALKSFKFSYSLDNISYTDFAATTDVGGAPTLFTTTKKIDTVDFTEITARYIKLTISATDVALDMANVVELEIYRIIEVSDRVISAEMNRSRDYKLANPLASTLKLACDNSDRFFSFDHIPTTVETALGFVNAELKPNIGVIAKYGYAYGGGTPEVAIVFVGYLDRITISPKDRKATLEFRDSMKVLLNQTVSSKLKTSLDLSTAMQYALNLANISNWEMSFDTTGLTLDYFFLSGQSVASAVRDLTQGAGDAIFYFNENGIATFKTFLGSTPQQRTITSQAEWEAGSVFTNIDTKSTPGQINRKWFLLDDFADNNFNLNPAWTNRIATQSYTDTSQADFLAGTVLTNIDTDSSPGDIQRKWFLIDDFADGNASTNPAWVLKVAQRGNFPPFAPNNWTVTSNQLYYQCPVGLNAGTAYTPFNKAVGTWEAKIKMTDKNGTAKFVFIANSTGFDFTTVLGNGYAVKISPNGIVTRMAIVRLDTAGFDTELAGADSNFTSGNYFTIRVTRDQAGNMSLYKNGVIVCSTGSPDTDFNTSAYVGFSAVSTSSATLFYFDDIYFANGINPTGAANSVQSVFESQVRDQSAQVLSEGIFSAVYSTPAGTDLQFWTATSNDGITWDAWVPITNGALIGSATKRYIKYRSLFNCPIDTGLNNANTATPVISSVTINYTVVGWQAISQSLNYLPGTSGLMAGIDLPFNQPIGTWRGLFTCTPGAGGGSLVRMYVVTTGYSIPQGTYTDGYYVQLDQKNSKIGIYKIGSSGTRTLLAEVAQAINTSAHSVRMTRESTGQLTVYFDEVQVVQVTDTTYTQVTVFSLEVDPTGDNNSVTQIDDIYFSKQVDGTGAITNVAAVYESQVIDMTASIALIGLFEANIITPTGTSLIFYTATSSDGITFDPYIVVAPGGQITSTVKRYLKFKAAMSAPEDIGTKADLSTPVVTDVTIHWNTTGGSQKYPQTVSFTFRYDDVLLNVDQQITDNLGGDSSIANDVTVQAKPLLLSGTSADTKWQGTVGTPPVSISVTNPLNVTNGQVLTYDVVVSGGMDISFMSGASPAGAVVTFAGGATGSWIFSRIHPTRPKLVITITASGTITDLRIVGKSFSNSNYIQSQNANNPQSIRLYGDRPLQISNQYIINSGVALTVATRLLANYKDPTSFVSICEIRPTFSMGLGDRIRIIDDNTDMNADFIAVGVRQSIQASMSNGEAKTELTLLRVAA